MKARYLRMSRSRFLVIGVLLLQLKLTARDTVVTSVENIYTAQDILQMPTDCNNLDNIKIIIEEGTEAPIVLHPEYESSNVEDIGENRNLYLKDDRKIPSLLQKQAEDNL
jgi:hypothetical protein